MKATLCKLKEGWVLCSKQYIEPNNLYINNGVLFTSDSVYDEGNNPNNSNPRVTGHNYKVLTQSPNLSSLSPDEQKEIGWFDVEQMSDNFVKEQPIRNRGSEKDGWVATGFVHGFQKALELTADRRFTEEDINKAYNEAYQKGYNVGQKDSESHPLALTIASHIHNDRNNFISKLLQPKSWEVEVEEVNGVYKVINILN